MDKKDKNDNLKIILDDPLNLSLNQIRRLLNNMSSSEIAHALESSPPKQRDLLFSLLKTEEEGDVLSELGEEIQQDLISTISNEELSEAVKTVVMLLDHLRKISFIHFIKKTKRMLASAGTSRVIEFLKFY